MLLTPRCTCRTTERNRLLFTAKLFMVQIENHSKQNRLANCKVRLEGSFQIKDSNDQVRYLLGFTVHKENHYYGYIFNNVSGAVQMVRLCDLDGISRIPNPWNEILVIDDDIKIRPSLLIYHQLEPEEDENIIFTEFYRSLSESIEFHRSSFTSNRSISKQQRNKRQKVVESGNFMIFFLLLTIFCSDYITNFRNENSDVRRLSQSRISTYPTYSCNGF